ncbi:MAG TPA: hypothetical protein PKL69_13970, partial [Agitococcus sp.]|nr:hypothetical protein [Agitococcus sp.]
VGRKNDGLDFFPTPQVITQQMIEAAEITPDMAVLEPSAGMGHIADMIRATGAEPDVIEMSGERRELLKEKGYHLAETNDFMDMQPRKFFTYGDVFRAPDGKEGVMRGSSGQRVMLLDSEGNSIGYYNRDELEGVRQQGVDSGYDRIIMNPPFSNRQDAEHVRHAYDLLKPNGRIVAIMGEGVFFGSDKKAVEFREWLDSVGGTSEKLPDNSFMDKSLPVNTGVNARMVVIDKQESNNQDADNKPDSKSATLESDIPKEKTVTQEQVERYNAIRLAEGDKKAQEVLKSEMDDLGFNSTERMHAWDALKAQSYQEQKDAVAAEKAAKKAEKAAKPSIKQIAEAVIAKSFLFNQREQQFLNDIKTKRKLTEKQESWLRTLAEKADIEIIGDFDNRKSKYENTNISFEDYVEDFLDMSVGLMSQQQKEDAYKTYQSWL